MHKTLLRQITRYLGGLEGATEAQLKFFEAVSKTYSDYEKDYALMERSLDISSTELSEVNEKIRTEAAIFKERAVELEKINSLMVNRELKMVELKEKNQALEAKLAAYERQSTGTAAMV